MPQPVDLADWQSDEEFAIFPVGSKPKRMIICPTDTDSPGLIADHSYLFKTPEGWQSHQIWSELIAYEIAQLTGLDVPRCHIGFDSRSGEIGALIEFFYGYPGEHSPARFIHASDLLRLTNDRSDRPHGVRLNIWLCKRLGLVDVENWWAKVLAFDALIGNTDRHPENWGFLVRSEGAEPQFAFAPAFDNATSLGYEITQARLPAMSEARQLEAYVNRGTHHCSWDPSDTHGSKHLELCGKLLDAHPEAANAMQELVDFSADDVAAVLQRCAGYDVTTPFTPERANFVGRLIENRRIKLAALCGG